MRRPRLLSSEEAARPQHRLDGPADVEISFAHPSGQGRDVITRNGGFAQQETADPLGQSACRRGVIDEHRDQVVAAPPPAMSQDGLFAVVVAEWIVVQSPVFDGPAGQNPRRLFDVGLGVVPHADREQLHQLRQVLIGLPARVLIGIEPDEQGRVMNDAFEQLAVRARANSRKISFCRRTNGPTLPALVAKWSCQNSASRSPSGSGPATMR